jgi:hypothetical protein
MSIKDDAVDLLMRLADLEHEHPNIRSAYIAGPDLEKLLRLGIGPQQLSDAVAMLEQHGYLDVLKAFGTDPYDFSDVMLTSRGRFEADRLKQAHTSQVVSHLVNPPMVKVPSAGYDERQPRPKRARSPRASKQMGVQPVGSPFGFTVPDWEAVSIDHENTNRLIVVFGHQSESEHFNSSRLQQAVEAQFQRALIAAQDRIRHRMSLDFRVLRAGYGGHLFNQIARDIIGADIAVFETSDHNPNVMIEMGVALTWGTRVHPIRRYDRPKPPSDISGQTWALYKDDGSEWTDLGHDVELAKMVEMACLRKPRRG